MRHSHWVLLATLVALMGSISTPSASAQDMSFDMEDTGQAAAPPPSAGAPSQALANALRFYQDISYEEAAVQLQRVVEGETEDDKGNQQKAQFFLGKTLFRGMLRDLGMMRYQVFMHLFLWFVLIPIKMGLRWTVNLKYFVSIPEYFFNI